MNTLIAILLIAAVPFKWTVETSKVQPAQFDVVHGESIALEATLQSGGKPLDLTSETAHIYWQTNGMGQAWWVGAATVTSNRLSAVFLPEMDPGAAAVTGFLGVPGEIYRAAFQLRFRHGPGAIPNEIEPPVRTLDFARVVVTNAPWQTALTAEQLDNINAVPALQDEVIERFGTLDASKADKTEISSLSNRVEELTGGAVTESDVRGIVTEMGSQFGKVQSVNGKTGTVVIAASDVGALSSSDGVDRVEWTNGGLYIYSNSQSGHPFAASIWTTGDIIGSAGDERLSDKANKATTLAGYGITNSYTKSQTDAALANKASAETVTALGQQVSAIGLNLNAEDAKVVITNYDSVVHMPESSYHVKVEGAWLKVWDEMTRWNWFLGEYSNFSNQVNQALSNKGEKEWGWFNSATGDASPDGILQLAQPRIQICSGAAYQRYANSSASYWVLESNGLAADINGTTNGFFRISDEEGNAQFEIVKGDKQTVFATAKTMRQEVMGVTHFFTEYAVTNAVSAPVAEFTRKLELDEIEWIAETSSSCPFNTRWTDKGNNTWEIEWWPKGTEPSAFMKCGYERGGETYIRNSIPVSMEYIILNGIKYRLGTATISGNTVLTLTRISL